MSEAKRLAMDDYTSTPSELATEATDACAAKKSVTTVFANLAQEQGLPSTTFDRAVTTTRENLIIEVAKTFTRIREQFPELYRVAAESAKLGKSREERRRYGNFGIALVRVKTH